VFDALRGFAMLLGILLLGILLHGRMSLISAIWGALASQCLTRTSDPQLAAGINSCLAEAVVFSEQRILPCKVVKKTRAEIIADPTREMHFVFAGNLPRARSSC